jgi:hypothetical protein
VLPKSYLDVEQTHLWGGFVEHLRLTEVAQQCVAQIIAIMVINLVTPKAGAKHELLFNKLASEVGCLNT